MNKQNRHLMTGRSIEEHHRAATTLELLFDLVMVVAVKGAALGLHHALVEGEIAHGITSYCFSFFTIWLAWWNFTWFASAYDVDDTRYRLTVFVQMVGAMIMSVGNREMYLTLGVVGYVIMRLAMVSQWLRAAREDPERSATCRTYAFGIAAAQVGWCAAQLLPRGSAVFALVTALLMFYELSIPFIAESHGRIPWHPHHIAERYGLLTLIVLGEGVFGSINATGNIGHDGALWQWLPGVLLVCFSTAGVTFGLWWHYFHVPFGEILERNREAAVPFGYLHYFVFAALAAVGTGFEVLSDAISEGWNPVLLTLSLWTILIACIVYFLSMFAIRGRIVRIFRRKDSGREQAAHLEENREIGKTNRNLDDRNQKN